MMATRGNHGGAVRIDVCVCTYRRRELEDTLRSIGAMTVPDNATIRLIVADNDVEPSARDLVYALAAELPFQTVYVHCPASNISIARNACLDHINGDFLTFIDDDETVSKEWLTELLAVAEDSGADAVLGPVIAVYSVEAPGWMRKGDFHSTIPVWVRGEILTGYTCNVMLRCTSPCVAGRRFDPARGQTGGEDTEYFMQLHKAGGTIAFAPKAVVYEIVPGSRARFSWLTKRRFRAGQTHGRLLGAQSGASGLMPQIGLAAAKVACCFVAASALAIAPVQRNRYALRGVMHAGVVSGLMGVREIRQYGERPVGRRSNAA
jgi:succinoglycan biosynthesis protein ExoM